MRERGFASTNTQHSTVWLRMRARLHAPQPTSSGLLGRNLLHVPLRVIRCPQQALSGSNPTLFPCRVSPRAARRVP